MNRQWQCWGRGWRKIGCLSPSLVGQVQALMSKDGAMADCCWLCGEAAWSTRPEPVFEKLTHCYSLLYCHYTTMWTCLFMASIDNVCQNSYQGVFIFSSLALETVDPYWWPQIAYCSALVTAWPLPGSSPTPCSLFWRSDPGPSLPPIMTRILAASSPRQGKYWDGNAI